MTTTTEKHYLTKEKYEELKKELEQLRTSGRKEVAEELEYSKQLGDLSENAEYHSARERQALLEDRISRLDTLLKEVSIVDAHHSEAVNVGSTVEILKEGKKESTKYTIVGSEEADMIHNKLSIASPIGVAMKGKKKGDTFTVQTPVGPAKYKIVSLA
jgi:transcription elongation factor GreA